MRRTPFHTTALCSPSRQALLTGRNHHAVGMSAITDVATSAPGYSSMRPTADQMGPARRRYRRLRPPDQRRRAPARRDGTPVSPRVGSTYDPEAWSEGHSKPTLWQRMAVRKLRRAAGREAGEPLAPEDWEVAWRLHEHGLGRVAAIFRALPSSPRCGICGAPFAAAVAGSSGRWATGLRGRIRPYAGPVWSSRRPAE